MQNISSPIAKVIHLSNTMDHILGLMTQAGEIQDADVLFNLIIFILISLRTEDNHSFGPRFIEEVSYIECFMQEDQIGMI